MENQDDLLKKIGSNDSELMAEAFREIKENGDDSILEPLLNLLETKPEVPVVSGIVNLLADVRASGFRKILTDRIRQTQDAQTKGDLLRIVWESSLDYSADLDLFLDILQNGEFAAAFEASTVIENLVHNLTEEQHNQLHELFESSIIPEDKRFLIENIIEEMECTED